MSVYSANRRCGFSLVEIAMVLAIAALIIAGVMVFFGNASNNQQTKSTLSEIAGITQVVRSLYAGQPDYTGLNTSVVAQTGQIPAQWLKNVSGMNSPFNQPIYVLPTGGTSQFAIQVTGLPYLTCVKLMTYDFGTGTYGSMAGTTATYGRPLAPASANAACASGAQNTFQLFQY